MDKEYRNLAKSKQVLGGYENKTLSNVSWFIKNLSQDYQDCALDSLFCEILIDVTFYMLFIGVFILFCILYYFSFAYRSYKHKCKMN
jgi:hypothetical protein